MKFRCMLAAGAIVVLSNIVVFVRLARDRAAEPFQTVELTERELPLATQPGDKSETALRIDWMHRGLGRFGDPEEYRAGVDRLRAAGFSCPEPAGEYSDRANPLPRQLYVVLRLRASASPKQEPRSTPSTAATGTVAMDANRLPPEVARRRASTSRLEVVDIGADLDALRRVYPEPKECPIFRGVVEARVEKRPSTEPGGQETSEWVGRVQSLMPQLINVPLPHSRELAELPAGLGGEPRYSVTLKSGRNLEPWAASVTLLRK